MKLTQPGQTHTITLDPSIHLDLELGAAQNLISLANFSPWKNFPDKLAHLTAKYYLYLPKHYQPKAPNSRARRLITEYETLTLGSIRYPIYFGIHKLSRFLEPQHLELKLSGSRLHLTHLAQNNWTQIKVTHPQ